MEEILTIGHSTHPIEHFLGVLRRHGVTTIADVRSVPASRFTPHFNRDALRRALREIQVKYVFLGRELGARPDDPTCYLDGQVQYGRLARTQSFAQGIERVLKGLALERIALMCAEQEPLDCHRTVLVARVLTGRGVNVEHIHGNGRLESHTSAMERLMSDLGLGQDDLFHSREEVLSEALARQEQRIAYVDKKWGMEGLQNG